MASQIVTRKLAVVLLAAMIAGGAGYLAGRKSTHCRYRATKQAEFIHLGQYSVVILAEGTVREMFGPDANELTLFYGFNRAVNEQGERGIVRSTLIPDVPSGVRAVFFGRRLTGSDRAGLGFRKAAAGRSAHAGPGSQACALAGRRIRY